MAEIIDARGLACPEPVLLTKKAVASGESAYEVMVDNQVAVENVSRFAMKAGYGVQTEEENGEFRLRLQQGGK